MSNGLYTNEPRPRLCHLRRWPDFAGYGFNLHCEKAKAGQFIGKVDANSPAEAAGLREHDRIIEVNFVPIGNENHRQVVARIKEGVSRDGTKYQDEVILLVVDPETDEHYKQKSMVIRSTDANVIKLETPLRNPATNGDHSPQSSTRSSGNVDSPISRQMPSPSAPVRMESNELSRDYKHVTDFTGPTVTHTKKMDSPAISRTSDRDDRHENWNTYVLPSPAPSDKQKHQESPPTNLYANTNPSPRSSANDVYTKPVSNPSPPSRTSAAYGSSGVLELTMSAAEYRQKLREKQAQRRDPRQTTMSMKQKHDLIDQM